MSIDEILLIFLMPILLFYIVQLVLMVEFHDLALRMLRGERIFSMLCKYDECISETSLSCLSNDGKNIANSEDPIYFEKPRDCHINADYIEEYRHLNPFRRIREDFIVLVSSIFLTVLILDIKEIITIPKHLQDSFLGLYVFSILSLFVMGYLYKPNRDDFIVLLVGVHSCLGFIIFWYMKSFEITWENISFVKNNILLSSITNNFTMDLSWFIAITIWVISIGLAIPWRFLVPKNDLSIRVTVAN